MTVTKDKILDVFYQGCPLSESLGVQELYVVFS